MMRAVLCGFLATVTGISQAADGEFTSRSAPVDLLRAYTYASCVEAAYRNTDAGADALRIAESLRESLPSTQPTVFAALRDYAASQRANAAAISNNANFALLRCLEMFNGSELRKVIRKELKKK